jgi:hypothetical protein
MTLVKSSNERESRSTLVDHDDIDQSGIDVVEQLLESRSHQVCAGEAAVRIDTGDNLPALSGAVANVLLARRLLRIQRIEILIEPLGRRFARIDRAADRRGVAGGRFDQCCDPPSWPLPFRPKKRKPFHLVPVISRARAERLS